jgi:ADP-ribosyl-[dinitrogen reductase] hydrolase
MIEELERYRGGLLGLAVGDALGTTLEFQAPGTFDPIGDIEGGGPFHLKRGEWTDDTSMALCLAESLIESNGFDAFDQMGRYCRWKNEGYLSSNGSCFDMGATVGDALRRFERSGDPVSGSTDPNSAGNGSLMRLAPVPLFYAGNPRAAIEFAAESSRTTHGAQEAVDACRYYAALIVGALQGIQKDKLLDGVFEPLPSIWKEQPLAPKILDVAKGSFKRDGPRTLSGTGGYVVPSLAVALWAFYKSKNFRDGALLAVNVGFDADTYGAIYGQLAGAYYGESGIPKEWREVIAKCDLITSLAEQLFTSRADRLAGDKE